MDLKEFKKSLGDLDQIKTKNLLVALIHMSTKNQATMEVLLNVQADIISSIERTSKDEERKVLDESLEKIYNKLMAEIASFVL